MYFSNLPEGFPDTGGDILHWLEGCRADLVTEVRIMLRDELVGIKRFRGEEAYQVNVACHLRGAARVEPLAGARAGLHEQGDRVARYNLLATQYDPAADGPAPDAAWIDSGELSCTAAREVSPVKTALSEIGDHFEISTGEAFEISVISSSPMLSAKVGIRTVEHEHQLFYSITGSREDTMFTLLVDPSELEHDLGQTLDATMDLEVDIENTAVGPGMVSLSKTVRVRPKLPDQVRLCWLNRMGALDYYTFSSPVRHTFAATKNRTVTPGPAAVAHVTARHTVTVQSPFATPACIARLAGIISSPNVWRIEQGEALPVDILSDRIEIGTEGLQKLVLTLDYLTAA